MLEILVKQKTSYIVDKHTSIHEFLMSDQLNVDVQ